MKYDHEPRRRRDRRTAHDRPRRDHDDHTRRPDARDASSDWRRKYHTQAVPLPDGGERRRHVLPDVGATVRDHDDDDGAELLVIDVLPDTRADEHRLGATGRTVAAHNPERDPAAPVVVAVYQEDLADFDGWRDLQDLRNAADADALRAYHFPADRLAVLDDETPGEGGERA